MKSILIKSAFILMILGSITACKSNKENHTGKEYTSTYICPMNCEGSGSKTKGNCPVCDMDYVKNNQ